MSRVPRVLRPVALLLWAWFPLIATAGDADDLDLYFRAAMTIEPDGSVTRLEWTDGDRIPAVLRHRLEERVRSWEFAPGLLDGQPARTETTLRLRLLAQAQGGGLAITVQDARTGASVGPVTPPAFPRNALRAGQDAAVLARVVIAPGGEPEVSVAGYAGDERWRGEFTGAVAGMFDDLSVQFEQVGGRPAPAEFTIPVEFCAGSGACGPYEWDAGDAAAADKPGGAVPVGSVARLLTDVRGTAI